jgi:hypothetical protein
MFVPSFTDMLFVFDDIKGRADVASGGRRPFAELVRCPLEAGWMCSGDGAMRLLHRGG